MKMASILISMLIKKIAQQEFLYNRANITQGVQMKQNQHKSLKGPTISWSAQILTGLQSIKRVPILFPAYKMS